MTNEKEITTIQITKATRDKLKELGKKGETYDDIITELLSSAKRKR